VPGEAHVPLPVVPYAKSRNAALRIALEFDAHRVQRELILLGRLQWGLVRPAVLQIEASVFENDSVRRLEFLTVISPRVLPKLVARRRVRIDFFEVERNCSS